MSSPAPNAVQPTSEPPVRFRWRRWIGWTVLAAIVLPPIADVVSDPYGEVSDWYYAAALENAARGNRDLAEENLAASVEWSSKRTARAHGARAAWAAMDGRYDAALAELEKAAAIVGETSTIRNLRYEWLQRLGRHAEAVEALDEAVKDELDPSAVDRLMPELYKERRANILNTMAYSRALADTDLDAALQQANEAVRSVSAKHPDRLAMYLDTRGFVHLKKGNAIQALDDTDDAVEAMERYLESVAAQLRRKESSESQRKLKYRAAVDGVKQQMAVLVYHRALAHRALGHEKEAEADLRQVREWIGREPDETLF